MRVHQLLSTLVLSLFCLNSFSQTSPGSGNEIAIGIIENLYSEILKEDREIWIHLPQDLDSTKYYPVLYLLDAPAHFHVVTGMLKRLTPLQMPESIVVGIVNTDRTRDFTPTQVKFSRGHDTETSGGASRFMEFLDKELKPYINSRFPTENNNTIIGHSTAGLFVLYSYLHHIESFDNYLAIDPSLWWDKENLVNKTGELLKQGNRKDKSLYVAAANSIGPRLDTVRVRKSKREQTEQIRANLKFHDLLVKNSKQLNFKWEYFHNEDHGGVTIPAQYNGLRAVFSWFPFDELWRFNSPKRYTAKQLTGPFYKHYEKLSIRMKRSVKPDWQLINDIGAFMQDGHKLPEKALAYFEMNLHFYPNESRTHLALGNYYLAEKKKADAITSYTKAVEIDGNKEAKAKLKELIGE